MSPGLQSPIYNRFKYYSALKTGFEHLAPQEAGSEQNAKDMFETPTHIIETDQFIL